MKTQTQRIKDRKKAIRAKKAKTYIEILTFLVVIFFGYQVLNYLHSEDLKIELLQEAHAETGEELHYRDNARLARLTECNSKIDLLKEYHLSKQDIGTRCATIRTLSGDRLPYESIMEDIHTASKSDKFWEIYYDIKRIRIENGIEVQTEVKQVKVSQESSFDINKLLHKDWDINDERQDWLNYAYDIGGLDFVLTILAENGIMGIDRKSGVVGANGYSDYGLCQVNVGWHPDVLSDGSNGKRFKDWFYDPYKQLDYCEKKFSGGTRFYGYDVRHKMRDKLIFD